MAKEPCNRTTGCPYGPDYGHQWTEAHKGKPQTTKPVIRNRVGLRVDRPVPGTDDNGGPGVPVTGVIPLDQMRKKKADKENAKHFAAIIKRVEHFK